MKEVIQQWLEQNSRTPGLLACGVHFPDRAALNQSYSELFPSERLDEAWQRLDETLNDLAQHRITVVRLRWSYDESQLYFAMREDGICLGLFTRANPEPAREAAVDHLISQFLKLSRNP